MPGRATLLAYLQSNRQGQCWYFRHYGPTACFVCGYQEGLEDGYDYGYEDGRNEPDFEAEIAREKVVLDAAGHAIKANRPGGSLAA